MQKLEHGFVVLIRFMAISICCMVTNSSSASMTVSEIVDELQSVSRTVIKFDEQATMLDLVLYCREWMRETPLGNEVKMDLKFMKDNKGEAIQFKIGSCDFADMSMYSLLEECCSRCFHFFTIKNGTITIAPNLPEYMEERIWTNKKGKTIRAKWVGSANGDAQYPIFELKGSGKRIKIELDKMCAKDRKYLLTSRSRSQKLAYTKRGNDWLSPIEIYVIEKEKRERDYIKRAKDLIKAKSYPKGVRYKVFQVVDGGSLCHIGGPSGYDFSGELFFNPNLKKNTTAENEIYVAALPLHWVGTYTYTTVKDYEKTINAYEACSLDSAIFVVRYIQKLYDPGDERFESTQSASPAPPTGGERSGAPVLSSTGSGFFITENGYFVTNHHVVDGAKKVILSTSKGELLAKIVRVDSDTDLALLKVDGKFDCLKMSPNRSERLGRSIFTVGWPLTNLQGQRLKVTRGIISGDEGYKGDVRNYQIDASIQPGNSGGPVVDEYGYLVGVVVASLVNDGRGGMPQNVNYAIKKSYLLAFLEATPDCRKGIFLPEAEEQCDYLDAIEHVKAACAWVKVYK